MWFFVRDSCLEFKYIFSFSYVIFFLSIHFDCFHCLFQTTFLCVCLLFIYDGYLTSGSMCTCVCVYILYSTTIGKFKFSMCTLQSISVWFLSIQTGHWAYFWSAKCLCFWSWKYESDSLVIENLKEKKIEIKQFFSCEYATQLDSSLIEIQINNSRLSLIRFETHEENRMPLIRKYWIVHLSVCLHVCVCLWLSQCFKWLEFREMFVLFLHFHVKFS